MGMAEEIQKLDELRKSGALTEEEFQKAKAALLAGLAPPLPPLPPPAKSVEQETKTWGLFLHLSLLAGLLVPYAGFIAPIVIWQVKKNELPAIDLHGKNVTNWIISMVIYSIVAIVLSFFCIGFVLLIALGIVGIVCPIIGAIKAQNGEVWKYPLTITFLK
jgi:uncharacterized protein